ncbi:TonB-dependent receptor family protein [[Flexibacter] sp. ATCC 35208]|uniref:TonB-dependent receptor family protein n=1 Tax=[Flexibacter] sp. ATCC 35208 TaxID=1936242 RepID=UPI0009CD1224|nr:TonB-dependent receptor family protein [[Flexibacter] sp. ATCC 35208]OMP77901.1 TonB-dependent receptor [[Flexibacter] sp. ATCC 35208]
MNRTILLLAIIFPCFVHSQSTLIGTVSNNEGVVPFANVILTDTLNKLITGVTTDETGKFSMNIPDGRYQLNIRYVGYKDWVKVMDFQGNIALGTILLEKNVKELTEVVVKSKKPLVEYQADRFVFNVEDNLAVKGGNALNTINVTPGVVLQNNAINILGKGTARVMIDGRMLELTGSALTVYLNSISASDIKSIEVITNPPAKYDAAGEGLINIVLKKAKINAWQNATTVSYDRNKYGYLTVRDNFFYSKNKLRLTASASGVSGSRQHKSSLDMYFDKGVQKLEGDEKGKMDEISGRATVDYDFSDKVSAGIQYQGSVGQPDRSYKNLVTLYTNNDVDSFILTHGDIKERKVSHSANGHFIASLDTLGRKLSFDVDYFRYDDDVNNYFRGENYTSAFVYKSLNVDARNTSNQVLDNISVKLDMEHPTHFANFSYGAKYSVINTNSGVEYYDMASGQPVLDPNQSNLYDYKERNQAYYVSGSKNFGEKWSLRLGLRVENTRTEGYSHNLDQTNKNNYTKLFPTFYLGYKANKDNNFIFNYGRRITRPDFYSLNPFRIYITNTSYSEGNPFLQPSFTDKLDFTYSLKDKFRTNIFLNIITNGFGVVFKSDEATHAQIITRENYYKEHFYGIGEIYTEDITSWWQSRNTVFALGSNSRFDGRIDATPQNGWQIYTATNNTFSIGDNTKLQLDYSYSSPFKKGLYEIGYRSKLDLSIGQSFMDKKLNLTLLMNDIFNSAFLRDYTSIVNGVKQVYNENVSSRFFRISLSYNFGNDKIRVNKRAFGNEEEKDRTK